MVKRPNKVATFPATREFSSHPTRCVLLPTDGLLAAPRRPCTRLFEFWWRDAGRETYGGDGAAAPRQQTLPLLRSHYKLLGST